MSRFTLHALAVGVATASLSLSAQAATEISWWHAMGGQLGEILEEMTQDFNESQDDYHVTPSYRGTYTDDGRDRRLPCQRAAAYPAGV